VGDSIFSVKDDSRYLLKDLVYHSAVATTDYYSLDLKFISKKPLEVESHFDITGCYLNSSPDIGSLIKKKFDFHTSSDECIHVIRIGLGQDTEILQRFNQDKIQLLVAGSRSVVKVQNSQYILSPMVIYRIRAKDYIRVSALEKAVDLFFFEL